MQNVLKFGQTAYANSVNPNQNDPGSSIHCLILSVGSVYVNMPM